MHFFGAVHESVAWGVGETSGYCGEEDYEVLMYPVNVVVFDNYRTG